MTVEYIWHLIHTCSKTSHSCKCTWYGVTLVVYAYMGIAFLCPIHSAVFSIPIPLPSIHSFLSNPMNFYYTLLKKNTKGKIYFHESSSNHTVVHIYWQHDRYKYIQWKGKSCRFQQVEQLIDLVFFKKFLSLHIQ